MYLTGYKICSMALIESLFNNLPSQWAILALIAGIGISVVVLRGLIRFAMRAFVIGLVGVILLGAVYYLVT